MTLITPLHTSPLSTHFHWEYQALVLLALAGLWLFLAGRSERRQRHGGAEENTPRREGRSW